MKKWWKEPATEGCSRHSEAGFTLMELLIVMAVILILMLVAIPSLLNMTIQAHETSALASLRAIQSAEVQYQTNFPANGYACTIGALGGSAGSGPPTAQAAQMLQSTLASGQKDGYTFAITNCTKTQNANNQDMFTSVRGDGRAANSGQDGASRLLHGYVGRDQGRHGRRHQLHRSDLVRVGKFSKGCSGAAGLLYFWECCSRCP